MVEPPGQAVPPAARIVSSNGDPVLTDAGGLDIYTRTCTHHGDVLIDPTKGNFFIPGTTAIGPDTGMLKFFTDTGSLKLALRWGNRWWWFTPSSNTAV